MRFNKPPLFQRSFQFVNRKRNNEFCFLKGADKCDYSVFLFTSCLMNEDVIKSFKEIFHIGKKRMFFVSI